MNSAGRVVVRPDKDRPEQTLDLYELAHDLEAQGVNLPVLLRFSEILKARIEMLHARFASAIAEFQYTGKYTTVYPIKVNQQRHVIEEIVEFGEKTGVGLECGSKPELQAVLALTDRTDHLIICNGYKDEEFMRLALMGQKLGHTVLIVIEQVSELDVLLPVAKEMNVTPTIGVRIKLSSEGSGRWAQSGGEKSKFGLTSAQLMQVIERLKAEDKLDFIKLIHFHLGSQITDIRFIKRGLQEVSRFYVELRRLGLDIRYVDVGGGSRRGLRRLAVHRAGLDELLRAGVRQRHRVHPRRDLPRGGPPDAGHHLRVGACAHRASRAAAALGDRRGVRRRAHHARARRG